jgi:hypothetical protein
MIGHEAKGQGLHRDADGRLGHDFGKGLIVVGLM